MPSKKVLIISGSIVGGVLVVLAIVLPLTLIDNDDDTITERVVPPKVQFQWTCEAGGFCQKKRITDSTRAAAVGLNTCQLICNPYAGIWPRPNAIQMTTKTLKQVDITKMYVTPRNTYGVIEDLVRAATRRFRANAQVLASERNLRAGGSQVHVKLDIADSSQRRLTLETDESYKLIVASDGETINVLIEANNYFGARHGLESLSQILVYDNVQNQMNMPMTLTITDAPKYKLRGLMLDTSRSYMSIATIKRTIDGLAATKMNTFHWHMTDSHSFPFVSKRRPRMSKIGAYSQDKVYTPEDIKEIVEYGRVRGVRLLMELDAPAHVGEGWQDYKDHVVCFNKKPWNSYCAEPPCGQLDPTNDGIYDVLSDIYKDIIDYFDIDMFHMGGDEIAVPCWESVPSITEWMVTNNYVNENDDWDVELDGNPKYMKLWDYFQRNALERFDEYMLEKVPIILWSSHLTAAANLHYLDKDRYIIQVWTPQKHSQIKNMLDLGYRVIISNFNALYLDCGFGDWNGEKESHNWCSPYKGWQEVYENRLENMVGDRTDLVIGGETHLWSEQTDDFAVDSRLWPRTAAYGERLWSDPAESFKEAFPRMLAHRERLVALGINADLLQPEWCYQHEANCVLDGFWNTPESEIK